jgi:exodeoxyribonuclease V alpha subunit
MRSSIKDFEISPLDRHFARFIATFAAEDEDVYVAAALVSMATRNGHSCLELREWAGDTAFSASGQTWAVPELAPWRMALAGCVGVGSGLGSTPLVLEDDRLYLRRYWGYEEEVAREFLQRGRAACLSVDDRVLADGLARCFPLSPGGDNDGQRLAVLVAMLRPLAVITGGPGTGKTTTVAMMLNLLAEQFLERRRPLRVALAAPTGKAARRLQESISKVNKSRLFQERGAGGALPEQVMTVHRLLGGGAGSSFRYDEKNSLPYDLVVVDEASMLDLPMMAKLFRALRAETRLILLGDRHQLASVEPGSVLGDLCPPSALGSFTREFSDRLKVCGVTIAPSPGTGKLFGLEDSLVELRQSHRFASASGIARLGAAVKAGDAVGAWEVLADPAAADVVWREVASPEVLEQSLSGLIAEGFRGLPETDPDRALAANEHFRLLCALRQGPYGAEQMNARFERYLAGHVHQVAVGQNYPGRPVMVLRNDYDQMLYNGDVGIMLPDPDQAGELKAYFPDQAGGFRKFSPARLPSHQTVYAMTVHKSQGSEFERILLVLPDRHAPVVSRELLFTAITRARTRVEIWGKRQVFEQAVLTSGERHSGLREKLWGDQVGSPGC